MRKGCLLEDYSNPVLRTLARSVLSNFILENKKLPLIFAFDATTLHFKRWTNIVFNPKSKSAWKAILEKYYETDNYKKLNEAVHGNEVLSRYATIHFLNSLFKKAKEALSKVKSTTSDKKDNENPVESLIALLDSNKLDPVTASNIVTAVARELENEAGEILKDIEVIEGFSHIGIPAAQFLDKPEEFREKARHRIVVHLVRFLQKLKHEAPNAKTAKMPTLVGGRPLGVRTIQRWSELTRTLPIEYLDDDLYDYRVASRSLRVYEQYGGLPNYVVYLDKSGSMAGDIRYCETPVKCESVPKISFATASALALAWTLKRYNVKMTLKLFDVEVHEPIADFPKLIDTLIRVKADSGTNITKVLEDAIAHHRDEKVIVVTDGIDIVSEETVKHAKSVLDVTFIMINTTNELVCKHLPCIHVKEAKPEILLKV